MIGGDLTETWPVKYPDEGARVYQVGATVYYTIRNTASTASASNFPIAAGTTPPVDLAARHRRLLRLERRDGFRSYVGGQGKPHAESAPPAARDAPRKLGRWLAVVRRMVHRETADLPEPVFCFRS